MKKLVLPRPHSDGADARRRATSGRRWAHAASSLVLAVAATAFAAAPASASHVDCGDVITTDTTLDGNVGPCPGTGIIIGADAVTLDLNGFSVIGDPQQRAAAGDEARDHAGIVLRMVSGSTVRNGTVRDFDAGIVVRGGSGNAVRDVTVRDNINYRIITGVNADPGDRASIADDPPPCDLGDGIAVFNSSNNVIEGNRVVNNGPLSGISLVENSDANLVSRNVVADNDILNVVREGAAENAGERTVCGTGIAQGPMTTGRTMQDIGIRIEGPGADDNRVERNQVTGSGLVGIAIHGYVCNPPTEPGGDRPPPPGAPNNGGNLVFKNNVSGTGVRDAEGNLVDPIADGIATLQQGPAEIVCVAHSNTIKNNVSTNNERDGIFMGGRGSHDNTVINNVVNDNVRDGLHLEGPFTRASSGRTFPGAINNKLLANKGSGNGRFDGADFNADCDNNMWRGSKFDTVNQPCVNGPGKTDKGNSRG